MIRWEESKNIWRAYDNLGRYLGYVSHQLNSFLAVKLIIRHSNAPMLTESSCSFDSLEQAKAFVLD